MTSTRIYWLFRLSQRNPIHDPGLTKVAALGIGFLMNSRHGRSFQQPLETFYQMEIAELQTVGMVAHSHSRLRLSTKWKSPNSNSRHGRSFQQPLETIYQMEIAEFQTVGMVAHSHSRLRLSTKWKSPNSEQCRWSPIPTVDQDYTAFTSRSSQKFSGAILFGRKERTNLRAIDLYDILMYTHLATVLPCIPLGAYLLARRKGDKLHRNLGKVYSALMFFTAGITLFMPALVGPTFLGHFGWIHLLSLLVVITVPRAVADAKAGRIKAHKRRMIMLYIGALLVAGGFTFWPGRFMHSLFFG